MPPKYKKRKTKGKGAKAESPKVFKEDQSILKLNDDCLHIIFSYFNLREVMTFEKVCPRFRGVAESFYRTQKKLDFDQFELDERPISRNEMRNIARRVGPYVTTLKIVYGRHFTKNDIIKPLFTHCLTLEHLHVEEFTIEEFSTVLKKTFAPLKTLKLINCDVMDSMASCIKAAVQLETLSLARNDYLEGSFLKDMKYLKEIDLSFCDNLEQPNFIDFCKDNVTLKSLRIVNWEYMDQQCLQAIVANLKNLETLGLGGIDTYYEEDNINLKILADLPMLIRLELIADLLPVSSLLQELVTRLEYLELGGFSMEDNMDSVAKMQKLKELRLHDISSEMLQILTTKLRSKNTLEIFKAPSTALSDDAVLEFVKQCPKLNCLGLSECRTITDNLIINLVPVLNDRPQKILIHVGGTRCDTSLDQQLNLLGNTKIQLNWNIREYFQNKADDDDVMSNYYWYQNDSDFYDPDDYFDYDDDSDEYQGPPEFGDMADAYMAIMAIQNLRNLF